MKEGMLEVLMYLFEHYMDDNSKFAMEAESICMELEDAGFLENEVEKAMIWLDGILDFKYGDVEISLSNKSSIRVFSSYEEEHLGLDCRRCLVFFEQIGIIDAYTREIIIDRALALDSDEVDLGQLKWVILMVLFKQPDKEGALVWMQDYVLNGTQTIPH